MVGVVIGNGSLVISDDVKISLPAISGKIQTAKIEQALRALFYSPSDPLSIISPKDLKFMQGTECLCFVH